MDNKTPEWQHRFSDFKNALSQFDLFFEKGDDLNRLEELGIIKVFEYTYELAWKTLKLFYESQGETGIQGSRDVINLAFSRELIKDGENWMKMLKDKSRTSEAYNEETIDEIANNILDTYYNLFVDLKNELEKIRRQ